MALANPTMKSKKNGSPFRRKTNLKIQLEGGKKAGRVISPKHPHNTKKHQTQQWFFFLLTQANKF
jgi:hypothetical protein